MLPPATWARTVPEAGGGTVEPESPLRAAIVVKHDREHDQYEQRGRSARENALGRHRGDATAPHGAQTSRASAAQGRRSYGCAVSAERPLSDELVIVANRLPVVRADDGTWEVSPGGLVSALAPIVQAGRGLVDRLGRHPRRAAEGRSTTAACA